MNDDDAANDDALLVAAVTERRPAAVAAFHDRFAPQVLRILARIVGQTQDLNDLVHDTFVRALGSIGTLRDPSRLDPWMTTVAVFTARTWLQRRRRQRWLAFLAPADLAELEPARPAGDPALAEALRTTYEVLDRLGTEERLVFALRFIEAMELEAIAEACAISVATVKRRLKRAERRFAAIARNHPVLADWVESGGRWKRR